MKITCISDTHFKHHYIDTREFSTTYLGKYTTVNASICDLNYVPFNSPISLHIE